jgi:hypothetical protein
MNNIAAVTSSPESGTVRHQREPVPVKDIDFCGRVIVKADDIIALVGIDIQAGADLQHAANTSVGALIGKDGSEAGSPVGCQVYDFILVGGPDTSFPVEVEDRCDPDDIRKFAAQDQWTRFRRFGSGASPTAPDARIEFASARRSEPDAACIDSPIHPNAGSQIGLADAALARFSGPAAGMFLGPPCGIVHISRLLSSQ